MSKTSWQTGTHWLDISQNFERNKARIQQFGRNYYEEFYWLCSIRGERGVWGKRYSDYWCWRIGKFGVIKIYFTRLNAKEVLITPKRWRIRLSSRQMVQQNFEEETANSKNTLWDGNPPWGERTSAENLMATGKSFNLKKQKTTKESRRIFGLTQKLGKNFIYRHHVESRSSSARAEKRIISYSTE